MTQASTTNKSVRGWDKIVAQLANEADPSAFHKLMLDVQCKIVAAEYGALWVKGQGEGVYTPTDVWPPQANISPELAQNSPIMKLLAQAAKSGFERASSHILKAEPEGQQENTDTGAHIFVTVFRVRGQVAMVSTVVADCRDTSILQSTAPLREMAAGFYDTFFSRLESKRLELDAQLIRQAMVILGVTQEAKGFLGAALNLVNEMARTFQCVRVSLGWVKNQNIRLIAMSDTEDLKRHSEEAAALELAMGEALDQAHPIVFPIPPKAEGVLQQAVVHSHKKLVAGLQGRSVLSVPLRHRDELVGVIVLERSEKSFDPEQVQFLQLVADIVGPHLSDRHLSDRWLPVHAWHSTKEGLAYLVGPKHTVWKGVAILVMCLLAYCAFGTWDYRVTAPFTLEAKVKRILPAPYEGRVAQVNKSPGDRVKKGDVLAQMETKELELQLLEARAKIAQATLEREKSLAENKMSEYQQANATLDQIKAQVQLLDYRIAAARITAPIDGYIIDGKWHDKIGAYAKQGDVIFEIAPVDDLRAVIKVSESDIDLFKLSDGPFITGTLATKSEPETEFKFRGFSLIPKANPQDSINAFEFRADIEKPGLFMHPGMEGVAKVEVGERPVWWVLTHRMTDYLRLTLWVW
jgi:GAF domain-containing protein